MTHDTVKDPNGSGKRVEALTIGIRPALAIMAIIITSGGGSAYWLNSQLNSIKLIVQQNSYDRWTRSMSEALCRQLERDNKGFKCPDELPRFVPPDNPFSG